MNEKDEIAGSFVLKFTDNLVANFIILFMIWEISFLLRTPARMLLTALFLIWVQCSANRIAHYRLCIIEK